MTYNYKILAETRDQFDKLDEAAKNLPVALLPHVETISNGFAGVDVVLSKNINSETIYLPDCTQISCFGSYIGCYCGDVFIRIPTIDNKLPGTICIFKKDSQ